MVDMQGRGDKADNFAWEVKKIKRNIKRAETNKRGKNIQIL
uniref:Uncharacterized protein n=1 Tax=Manihot esculenta TaxID=3983 RepID=A0A2C9W3V4_MANES